MAQLELPLPELVAEDFKRGWIRFEFVATAKEWDAVKQLAVIPALLRGKLIDYYVDFDDTIKGDLKLLRAALEERAGKKEDPLAASRSFSQRSQGQEAMTSSVLLQRLLTGLRPEISRQLLLRSKPTTFTAAVKDATEIEYALEFGGEEDGGHAIRPTQPTPEQSNATALHQKLDSLTKRLESLEVTIGKSQTPNRPGYGRDRGNHRDRRIGPCYNCGEEGHLRRNCPLNYYGPAPKVDDSWSHRP
ncbi:uncharacterized protein [Dysidea avara]|uniref:uncharacterized protein isoform X2 n=1 Tax=Dysidea avara TaxID=196820 RepID=UPI003334A7AB